MLTAATVLDEQVPLGGGGGGGRAGATGAAGATVSTVTVKVIRLGQPPMAKMGLV